ncbi:DUF6701 domain-containing protein [Vibrio sonorensis]|uniref:DUF6701 domain-containing protein n=1 Tax=Vibrio sonorensis TaxID=1004316 RepID=UPI0008DA1DB6|nr:DUF6701 domain-containing protein [Vibrio sonorensis]
MTDTSDFVFVPLKFEVNNGSTIPLVAGQAQTVNVKALACDATDKPIALNYSKSFDEGDVTISGFIPSAGIYNGLLDFSTSISNGQDPSATIRFDETGKFTGSFKDTISCDALSGVQGCPSGQSQDILGTFAVESRPWTFAICSGDTITGTSSSGAAYKAASSEFDLQVYPIAYQSGATVQDGRVIITESECVAPLNNPSLAGASAYEVKLDHEVHSPSGGEKGNFSNVSGSELKRENTDVDGNKKHQFTQLKWDEVGSINVIAETKSSGYMVAIMPSERSVGRFYPAYFTINESTWEPPDGQETTYLEQPYKQALIEVGAFNLDDNPVKNYHGFAPSYQASFNVKQDDNIANELVLTISTSPPYPLNGAWGAKSVANPISIWKLDDDESTLKRHYPNPSATPLKSVPNGPFNALSGTATEFGLKMVKGSSSVDREASFSATAVETTQDFPTQPPAIYGRMVLDSVGGNSGTTFNVPLRIEYWNGNTFVLSDIDNNSKVSTEIVHVCKETIWPSGGTSNAKLSTMNAAGAVSQESNAVTKGQPVWSGTNKKALVAVADGTANFREQIRFWMRLDTSAPSGVTCSNSHSDQPWLRYNWRDLGDEDPSAVITFGIFRGNDKVIFRGESGIFGQ